MLPAPGIYTIGRAPQCNLVIDSDTVSAMHAQLTVATGGVLMIRDLGSRNGTAVISPAGEIPVGAAGVRVDDSAVVRFGEHRSTIESLLGRLPSASAHRPMPLSEAVQPPARVKPAPRNDPDAAEPLVKAHRRVETFVLFLLSQLLLALPATLALLATTLVSIGTFYEIVREQRGSLPNIEDLSWGPATWLTLLAATVPFTLLQFLVALRPVRLRGYETTLWIASGALSIAFTVWLANLLAPESKWTAVALTVLAFVLFGLIQGGALWRITRNAWLWPAVHGACGLIVALYFVYLGSRAEEFLQSEPQSFEDFAKVAWTLVFLVVILPAVLVATAEATALLALRLRGARMLRSYVVQEADVSR